MDSKHIVQVQQDDTIKIRIVLKSSISYLLQTIDI